MGNPRGVRRDFDALEARRLKAARLLKQGATQADVARKLGVHRQSVYRWQLALEKSGPKGLKKAGRAGRKPKLSDAQLRMIENALKEGPEALGYETGLWTIHRVADLIERRFGVTYNPSQVWRILRGLGWSCQRPSGRALERDEEAIRRWKRERWPALKKTPKSGAKRSSSSTRAG
jgi:transposase